MGHLKTSTLKFKNSCRGTGSDGVNWTTLAQGLVENNCWMSKEDLHLCKVIQKVKTVCA
jgi:hypothetical protein